MWLTADGDYIDTVEQPGQPGIRVVMSEIFESFTTATGRAVPRLDSPADGLSIDSEVRSGYPVLQGTRIPFDTVAALVEDGLTQADIIDLYPAVTYLGIAGAVELETWVNQGQHQTA